MKNLDLNIQEIAYENGLEVIQTTSSMNGYPSNIKYAIIGFESFEQAQAIADQYDLQIEYFKKKAGWSLWYRTGNWADKAYQISSETFGDNYQDYEKQDEGDFIDQWVQPVLEDNNFDTVAEYFLFLTQMQEIWEEIEAMGDDEIVIANHGQYFDTMKKALMSYGEDNNDYAIGLIK